MQNLTFFTPRRVPEHLRQKLISNEYFVHKDWGLPKLHYHEYHSEIDHDYHEFESFEWMGKGFTDSRNMEEFLKGIEKGCEF
ncbi:ferritin family protein [Mongoliitalea daihaiensis]|uniref:hypothetical protein n=1 Tax=Mongoliitalea daihaiensis TaxID=2782006 RepID=UPI001F45E060|nr:hypothetical protein [Mongoliitalea daihaiensis]UJP66705.1 hypothetical protein IPZ59_09015 [Mongoliitalea daihaiensis]